MKTKLEAKTSVIEHIEFCQTRPVFDGVSYTMVRNPLRMLSRIQWGVGKFNPRYLTNYLTSVGLCCISLGLGLPVEQYIGSKLAALKGKYVLTPQHQVASKMFIRPGRAVVKPPSMATRLSYELAWNISLGKQLELEKLDITSSRPIEHIAFPQYGQAITSTIEEHTVDPF
jgi:hypothetical protein